MSAWLDAPIAVVGTLLGTVLGYFGARKISHDERAEALRVEMRDAFAKYLAAAYGWVAELREMPPNQDPGFVERLVEQVQAPNEGAKWVRNRRALAKLGPGYWQLRHALVAAIARLDLLALPTEVRRAVDDANSYLELLAEKRTDQVKAEWPQIHERLQAVAPLLSGPAQQGRAARKQ